MYTSELSPRIQKLLVMRRDNIKRNFDNSVTGYRVYGDIGYLEDMKEDMWDFENLMEMYRCNHKLVEDEYCIQCIRCKMFVSIP